MNDMAKKKQPALIKSENKNTQQGNSLSDYLQKDMLEKLKSTKKQLQEAERAQEEERNAQAEFDRKQKEKNKSFAELLDEYGMKGKKF